MAISSRSPHAHARVKKIDDTEALKVPGVLAVITAETLKTVNLAWMPTLAGDVQMVLADGKVLFQNQEVAFVVATDRYAADDGINKVVVEYEPLPVVIDPFKAMDADAPVLREDLAGKTSGAHGPRKHHNHVFEWTVGDKDLTDAAFRKAEVTIKEMISYHRTHPSPLETCQCVCSFDKIKGELTIWGTFQAPHVIRTVVALIAKIPEHKIHVISPDIGGGFGNKVGAYPGYICAAVASIVTGKPVKVGRGSHRKPDRDIVRARLPHDDRDRLHEGRQGHGLRVRAGRSRRVRRCADPSKWPAGFFNIVTGSYDFPTASFGRRHLHQQGAGRRRLSMLVPRHRSGVLHRARDGFWRRSSTWIGRTAAEEFYQARAVPYHSALGWEYDSGDYPHRHAQDDGDGRLCRPAQGAGFAARGRSSAARPARSWASACRSSPRSSAPAFEELRHSRHRDVRFLRNPPASDGCGHRAVGTKSQGQGHETTWAQIIATEIGIPDDIMVEEAIPTPRPTGSAPTARARRRWQVRRSRWRRARSRPRRR